MAIGVLNNGQLPQFRSAYDIGGEIGESIGTIAGAVGKGFAERKTEQNKAKVDEYLMQYNSRTGAFQGMADDKLATEKLARLLLPLDESLANRYMVKANELEKFGQDKALAEARESGLTDREKINAEAKKFEVLNRPKEAEKKDSVKIGDLKAQAFQAYNAGQYEAFYQSKILENPENGYYLPQPKDMNDSKAESLIKESVASGATLGTDIKTKEIGLAKTTAELPVAQVAGRQAKIEGEGLGMDYGLGNEKAKIIPKAFENEVSDARSTFQSQDKEVSEKINSSNQLLSTLGNGKMPVQGINAIASIFQFMKALDPASTVREGEFQAIVDAGGIMARVNNAINQGESSVTLRPEEVQAMQSIIGDSLNKLKAMKDTIKVNAEAPFINTPVDTKFITGQSAPTSSKIKIGERKSIVPQTTTPKDSTANSGSKYMIGDE